MKLSITGKTLTDFDKAALAAAQAKRDRKAAKRLELVAKAQAVRS